jgi:hypothetical protein
MNENILNSSTRDGLEAPRKASARSAQLGRQTGTQRHLGHGPGCRHRVSGGRLIISLAFLTPQALEF